jgi:protease-4
MKRLFLFIAAGIVFLVLLALLVSVVASFTFLSGDIAVIPIKGEIMSDTSFSYYMSSDEISEKIREADKDPLVKAILLDIDSGGGSVVATKEIVYAVREAKKPVVAYIGGIGASGAYYIAAASDLIVADEDSITGSIGVISISSNVEGLLDKIGVKIKILKEGKFKDIGSPFKELTPEEENILRDIIGQASSNLKEDILEFRKGKISAKEFNELADGRIFSGRKALEAGLIDFTGSKQFAIKKAAELAGIEGEPSLKEFSKRKENFFSVISGMGYSFGSGFVSALKNSNSGFSLEAK